MKSNLYRKIRYGIEVIAHIFGFGEKAKHCLCCGYTGIFEAYGHPPRYGVRCPSCRSLERHRLLLLINKTEELFSGKDVIHFAPEPSLTRFISQKAKRYVTADNKINRADLILDIEKIDQPDESWDVVLCCHVLEHVNDRLALKELNRILRKDGQLIIMVPIIEGWDRTYENPTIVSKADKELHFGQYDHVRYYGRDFRYLLKNSGFNLCEFTAFGADCTKYGLLRGEKVFVSTKEKSLNV